MALVPRYPVATAVWRHPGTKAKPADEARFYANLARMLAGRLRRSTVALEALG